MSCAYGVGTNLHPHTSGPCFLLWSAPTGRGGRPHSNRTSVKEVVVQVVYLAAGAGEHLLYLVRTFIVDPLSCDNRPPPSAQDQQLCGLARRRGTCGTPQMHSARDQACIVRYVTLGARFVTSGACLVSNGACNTNLLQAVAVIVVVVAAAVVAVIGGAWWLVVVAAAAAAAGAAAVGACQSPSSLH